MIRCALLAAVVLLALRRPWQTAWTRGRLVGAATFGVTISLVNVAFYLAIAHLALGTAVAIEFVGPVAVAAAALVAAAAAVAAVCAWAAAAGAAWEPRVLPPSIATR